jgi:hypothetical protein
MERVGACDIRRPKSRPEQAPPEEPPLPEEPTTARYDPRYTPERDTGPLPATSEDFTIEGCTLIGETGDPVSCRGTMGQATFRDAALMRAFAARVRTDILDSITDERRAWTYYSLLCNIHYGSTSLVSYVCKSIHRDGPGEVGEGTPAFRALAYTIDGANVAPLRVADLLAPGVTGDLLIEARCRNAHAAGLGPGGIVCERGRPVVVIGPAGLSVYGTNPGYDFGPVFGSQTYPYVRLGRLLRPDSALSRIPGALDYARTDTALAREFLPR